jgi:hypothetical protein
MPPKGWKKPVAGMTVINSEAILAEDVATTALTNHKEPDVRPTTSDFPTQDAHTFPIYQVRMLSHARVEMGGKLGFEGLFSECMEFVRALDDVKPGSHHAMNMERITAPYEIIVRREDGSGTSFLIKNKMGHRASQVFFDVGGARRGAQEHVAKANIVA